MSKTILVGSVTFVVIGALLFLFKNSVSDGDIIESREKEEYVLIEDEAQEKEDDNNDKESEREIENIKEGSHGSEHSSFMECLVNKGVVIYGSKTCPACRSLSEEYGGYEKMEPIYVECTEEAQRCIEEMLVGYVPVVQINGKLFDDWGSPENLGKETGCRLDN